MPDGIASMSRRRGTSIGPTWVVPDLNDGSIERADLDGGNRQVIVPQGVTHTPKQIHLDKKNGKLYWCDREGHARDALRISMARRSKRWSRRAAATRTGAIRPDGASESPSTRSSEIYWTQKGPDNAGARPHLPRQHRYPEGREPGERSDIEVFFDRLPEPIDLELDLENRVLYWTDRGDPPRGNTVNRAPIDAKPQAPEILITHLMEGIGIALDVPGNRMFVTDFAGSVYSANLDGKNERNFLYAQGNLTGIAYTEI